MIAAMKRKVYEIVQVIRLHSALSKSNMQIHNLRKSGDGRYLIRVSVAPNGVMNMRKAVSSGSSPFANAGLIGHVSGTHERMANESKFATYFEEAMSEVALDHSDAMSNELMGTGMELAANDAAYTEFSMDRKITTRRAADWGLRAMLRNFGCDVDDAEMVSDAGYGSQWIAVAFAAA